MLPNTIYYRNVTTEQLDLINCRLRDIPVNIMELVADFHIELKSTPLDNRISGILDMTDSKHPTIHYNSTHGNHRQRFTIAHELGHYVLHGVTALLIEDTNNYYSTSTTRNQERDANRFAADVLMPMDSIDTVIRQNPSFNLEKLAEMFEVSKVAMSIRLGYPT